MKKVGVVGIGALPFKMRYADKSFLALTYEAAKKALDDCKLTMKDVDEVLYTWQCDFQTRQSMVEVMMHDYIGARGKPSLDICAAAASDGHVLHQAYCQIASGMSDVVMVLGCGKGTDLYSFETKSRGDGLLKAFSMHSNVMWGQPLVSGVTAWHSVVNLVPHIRKYGNPTEEQIAKVSVKNHNNALTNPDAQLKTKVSVEDVMNSRIIAWPTTMLECCLYSEGSAALVLASEEKTRELTDSPIWMSGVGVSDYALVRFETETMGRIPGVSISAQQAYKMAGIKDPINELDVVELYDLISGLEVIAYEDLGLCKPGECGQLVDEGVTEKGGKVAVNPTGGRVACGHVGSVSAFHSACSVVKQLRGTAEGIQVPIRHGKGLVECIGGDGDYASVIIFEREK